jgi:photosystem II stability/assembly factor-like uncharacterized protein
MAEGHDGLAYAWNDGRDIFAITVNEVRTLKGPAGGVGLVAADASDKNHLMALGEEEGGVFESTNAGITWQKVGDLEPRTGRISAFAARDLEHILVVGPPSKVTRDGGRTWVTSTGPELDSKPFLPADGHVAWAFGEDFYRSTDGGASFARVGRGPAFAVLLGAQPDPTTLVFSADTYLSPFLLRFDVRSFKSTRQPLPIDPGHALAYGSSAGDVVLHGTFVPGEVSTLCLGISKHSETHGPM